MASEGKQKTTTNIRTDFVLMMLLWDIARPNSKSIWRKALPTLDFHPDPI
jgi:hypothetical protein